MSNNPFAKGWKYLKASVDQHIDENADPKVQIQQAIDAAKRQHSDIAQQAAMVIGNKNQLEMKLDRLVKDQSELQNKARQAITLADDATAKGDTAAAQEYTETAEVYASQLVSVEQQLEETTALHQQATASAEQAKRQVQESEARLTQQLNEAEQLLRQANQARMQETATKAMDGMSHIDPDRDVPTLDDVRAKIESRYANALGAQELIESSVGDRMAEIESAGTDMKAAARLEEIRAQMHGDAAAIAPGSSEHAQLPSATDDPKDSQETAQDDSQDAEPHDSDDTSDDDTNDTANADTTDGQNR